MVGLRGVGKTLLLDRMRDDAESSGIHPMRIEAPEVVRCPPFSPATSASPVTAIEKCSGSELGHRALRALAGFATALKVKYADIEVGLDFEPEEVFLPSDGDLEHDLQALMEAVGLAAYCGYLVIRFRKSRLRPPYRRSNVMQYSISIAIGSRGALE